MFAAFLVAMQAAGSIMDWQETQNQKKLIAMGRQLEQKSFETNLEAIQLESSEASLMEMKQLKENLGSQIAMNAARGTSSAAGTAQTKIQGAQSDFNADERVRRMNLLTREAALRGNNVISGLHTLQSETQLGQNLTKRLMSNISTGEIGAALKPLAKSAAKKIGFGFEELF